jgi:hypothetical protein
MIILGTGQFDRYYLLVATQRETEVRSSIAHSVQTPSCLYTARLTVIWLTEK